MSMEWCQTFRLRAKCSPSAHRRLTEVFYLCCELCNACLESWRGTYLWWREHHPSEPLPRELSQSHIDRMRMFTDVRGDLPEWERLSVNVGRGVLRRFDRATKAFYRRCAEGANPGFPRFKLRHRWRSMEIPDVSASMVVPPDAEHRGKWWRLQVKGLPRLRVEDKEDRLAEALGGGGKVVELRVVRAPLRVEVHVVVKHPDQTDARERGGEPGGVDKGLSSRVVTSCGGTIPARTVEGGQASRAQRRLSRAKKGSRSRVKKRTAHAKVRRREKERARHADFRLAHQLVSSHDGIASEDLGVSGMLRSKRFSKKMSEQRWSALDQILEYKAWKAGFPYARVDPKYTSTDCSSCGHRQSMPLSVRVYNCGSCGLELCRDVNAARNIRARGFPTWRPRGREGLPPDATRGTNFCCRTGPPLAEPQTDVAEQYAGNTSVVSGI